jgi:hypothetical protein
MIEHMIDRQEDPEVLKRIALRARTEQSNRQLNLALKHHGGASKGRKTSMQQSPAGTTKLSSVTPLKRFNMRIGYGRPVRPSITPA